MIFYLYLFRLPPVINITILLIFAILVLLPIKYVTHHTLPFFRLTMGFLIFFVVTLVWMGVLAPNVQLG